MFPISGGVTYEADELTVNYVIPIAKGSTYTTTLKEVGSRLRIIALTTDPRTLTGSLSSGIINVVMNPEYDVGYSIDYTSTIDGYLMVYVSNAGEMPEVMIETDGVGGDGVFSWHHLCKEASSSVSLASVIKPYFRGYVLATVTTRSVTTFSDGWELLSEGTEITSGSSNQRMYFLSKKVEEDEDCTITVTQESSNRIYINLIAFQNSKGFQYHTGYEDASSTEAASIEVERPTQRYLVWGCSAISWTTSGTVSWVCEGLVAINSSSSQPRQANFVDFSNDVLSRTFVPSSSTTYIIDCVELIPQAPNKFLVRAEGIIYTIVEGVLTALSETDVTSTLFETQGVEEVPDWENISVLVDPEILVWQEDVEVMPTLECNMIATPLPQNIISNKAITIHESITGIENMVATCEGELIVAVSFDDKETWKAWNGEQWATLSESFTGMNKETLEAITFEQWNELYQNSDGFYLRVSLVDTTQSVSEIYVDFAN